MIVAIVPVYKFWESHLNDILIIEKVIINYIIIEMIVATAPFTTYYK
jgi:hypothetical protein